MNSLPYELEWFKKIGWLCFVLTLMVGCVHQSLKNKTSGETIQSDLSEQESVKVKLSWNVEFSEDFSDVPVGGEPESIFILDGEYKVNQVKGTNKCLSLPGSPMGDFGLLFGPREREKSLELGFSFYATKKGRRMPSIAASIGGVRGYKFRLNPAARKIVLSINETIIHEMPYSWQGEKWWKVRFQAKPGDSNQTTGLLLKLWPQDEKEPAEWNLDQEFNIEYKGGKCALWGFPYSSTPILFDNLLIQSN